MFPIILGSVFAALQLIFIVFQADKVTASSYIKIYPAFKLILGFFGTFSSLSGGLILMLAGRKKVLKVLGMIICVLPQLMLTLFYSFSYMITNLIFSNNGLPALWNYSIVFQFLIVLIIELVITLCFYFVFEKMNLIKVNS